MTARHTVITLAAALTAICLAACAPAETDSQPQDADSVTTSAAAETNEAEKTEAQTSKTEAQTEPTETTASSKAEADASAPEAEPTEEAPSFDLSEFRLSDYCAEFDEAEPVGYSTIDGLQFHALDIDKMYIALDAVKQTDYYAEVLREANDRFIYENGELVLPEEKRDYYHTEYYYDYLEYSESAGLTIEPEMVYNVRISFYGETREHLFVFRMPLPVNETEWSGTAAVFYVPVYVNSENNASVLYEACSQTFCVGDMIRYDDGEIHVIFGRGHSSGTYKSLIYSFKNGVARLEYKGFNVKLSSEGKLFCDELDGSGWQYFFFRDAKRDCYCGVNGAPLAEEAAEIILSSEAVLEQYPDINESSNANDISVIGGRYINFPPGTTFEIVDGAVVPYTEGLIIPDCSDYFDENKCLNINLN